jgi:hypothetical protein
MSRGYKIAFVQIGNSDDKLGQGVWSEFVKCTRKTIYDYGDHIIGEWFSSPDAHWQNACWMFGLSFNSDLRVELRKLAEAFGQESIAFTVAEETEKIRPVPTVAMEMLPRTPDEALVTSAKLRELAGGEPGS